jgi:hypothetical protein
MNMGLKKSRASELFQNGFGEKSKRTHAGGRFLMGLAVASGNIWQSYCHGCHCYFATSGLEDRPS